MIDDPFIGMLLANDDGLIVYNNYLVTKYNNIFMD